MTIRRSDKIAILAIMAAIISAFFMIFIDWPWTQGDELISFGFFIAAVICAIATFIVTDDDGDDLIERRIRRYMRLSGAV